MEDEGSGNTDTSLNVGLCQIWTEEWAVGPNVDRAISAIAEAAAGGAHLAVMPECIPHGYPRPDTEGYADRLLEAAEPADGPILTRFRDAARSHTVAVVFGFPERGNGDRVYNAAAVIGPDGDLLNVYRKVHLRPFESIQHEGRFTPGEAFSVQEIPYPGGSCKLGTMICFDREIPESVRCLRALGSQFIACPLATDTSSLSVLDPEGADNELVTRSRSAENEVYIAVVNHAGRFNGGSFLVGPKGEVVHQMGPEPGVHVLPVPIQAVVDDLHGKPLGWMGWGYRRQAVYDRYLK